MCSEVTQNGKVPKWPIAPCRVILNTTCTRYAMLFSYRFVLFVCLFFALFSFYYFGLFFLFLFQFFFLFFFCLASLYFFLFACFCFALKCTREVSENSLAFLDIKLSINDNSLSTGVHYQPTDYHIYLLHSPSRPQHVKNTIPFSQFLRLRRLCSDKLRL